MRKVKCLFNEEIKRVIDETETSGTRYKINDYFLEEDFRVTLALDNKKVNMYYLRNGRFGNIIVFSSKKQKILFIKQKNIQTIIYKIAKTFDYDRVMKIGDNSPYV